MTSPAEPAALARRLRLPIIILYGVGVTVGAGIYVLVGTVAGVVGDATPWSFILAAVVVGFSALAFAEWGVRRPESAGEAAYVTAGLGSPGLGRLVGLSVALIGIVSSAAISLGTGGYFSALTGLPVLPSAIGIALFMTAVALVGIALSAGLAATVTVIEVGGLVAVVAAALIADPGAGVRAAATLAPPEPSIWTLVGVGGLIAFFAFVGFEDIVNLAEEMVDPVRDMPRAIVWTLVVTTILYVAVVSVGIGMLGGDELGASKAPIVAMAEAGGLIPPRVMAAIGVIAGVNGILIQIVMASRVFYGMARRGLLPRILASVHPVRRTPVAATLIAGGLVVAGIVTFPIEQLASATSSVTLVVFATVCLALIVEKRRRGTPPDLAFRVPIWVPVVGVVSALGLLAFGMIGG